MYDAIGTELTADAQGAMRHWLAHRPREPQRPSHAVEDYGLTDSQVDERSTPTARGCGLDLNMKEQ